LYIGIITGGTWTIVPAVRAGCFGIEYRSLVDISGRAGGYYHCRRRIIRLKGIVRPVIELRPGIGGWYKNTYSAASMGSGFDGMFADASIYPASSHGVTVNQQSNNDHEHN
jgi:hypothetical protein